MTKINQIDKSAQQPIPNAAKNPKTAQNDTFQNTLVKALDNTGKSNMTNCSVDSLCELEAKSVNFQNTSSQIFGKTNDLLKMLDFYSSKLLDPSVSLKSIAPVLEQIKDNASDLLKETESVPESDPALKRIAQEAAVAANTEYFKFQRGDYLS